MSENYLENYSSLAHWRRCTAELYARIRQAEKPHLAWEEFRATRDSLFKFHVHSPLDPEDRDSFYQLAYYPYDRDFRVRGQLDYGVEQKELEIDLVSDGQIHLRQIASVEFAIRDQKHRLSLYWVQGYGGGLFLPFKDKTSRMETFGGGRYLYDTIKGADLGASENELILDFNFAYNPSCAYNSHWVCPLAPPENTLDIAVTAGEKNFKVLGA